MIQEIEHKTARPGEEAVELFEMKNLDGTPESLAESKQCSAELEQRCGTKCNKWNERSKLL